MRKPRLQEITRIALSAALLAICAWITIPAPVPFTLQTFGVFLVSGLFGKKKACLAVLIYILLGTMGIPVFSGGRGGIGILLGDTGGYIIGFLAAALACGSICEQKEKTVPRLAGGMLAGLFVCYLIGSLWAYFVYLRGGASGMAVVLGRYVLSFIIPDLAKLALAVFTVRALDKRGI